MAETVRDAMTREPKCLDASAPVVEAARLMRDEDIGAVIVTEADTVSGIVTDRDVVVRGIADGRDPGETRVGDVCSSELTTLSPDDDLSDAVAQVRSANVRRLPVVEDDKPVGILSLGDLAIERDSDSALADISAAPANN
jgi:CBS domain-containing protein